jgi:anti-sigma factor RsiW
MNDETHPWREDLGPYLLGALEAEEAERMRRHLEECAACRAEYAELAPVVNLLAKVPAEAFVVERYPLDEAPDPDMWERLRSRAGLPDAAESPSQVRFAPPPSASRPVGIPRPPRTANGPTGPSRRARRPMRPTTSALISGVLVAAAAFGIYAGTRPVPTAPAAASETVSATNAADGVSGSVQYHPTDWGSWIQITLSGVKPGNDCVLYAEDGRGDKAVASTWWAPTTMGESATIPGGVSMHAWDITSFQVTTTVGQVLLNIPAS